MYNSIHNTLIIGKKIIYLPSCHSTNDIAAELVHKGLVEEGTVVITDNQVGGRGQRGSTWQSEAGQNLTFSVILKPVFLPVDQQFPISQTVALALFDFLSLYTSDAKIKWPNDMYVSGKKLSGTLIENSIQGNTLSGSIVGIGININQTSFLSDRISSVANVTGESIVLQSGFQSVITFLDQRYNTLKMSRNYENIRLDYLENLYGYRQPVTLKYQNEIITGHVVGVADNGRILIQLQGRETVQDFGLKEIEWVWEN